jgi:hypothetical protein
MVIAVTLEHDIADEAGEKGLTLLCAIFVVKDHWGNFNQCKNNYFTDDKIAQLKRFNYEPS